MKQVFTITIDYPCDECKIDINEVTELLADLKKVFRGVICEDCKISARYTDVTSILDM